MPGKLLDYADPVRRQRTEVSRDAETGLPVIIVRQDTVPLTEANARSRAAYDPHQARRSPIVRVASLPTVVVMQLKAAGIWNDSDAFMRWLDQPENRHFRTDDGRRLR